MSSMQKEGLQVKVTGEVLQHPNNAPNRQLVKIKLGTTVLPHDGAELLFSLASSDAQPHTSHSHHPAPAVTRCAHMLLSTSRTALVAPQRAALRVAPRHARTQQLHRQHHQSVKTDSRGFMGLVYTAAASAATWLCGVGQTLAAHMCGPKQCTQDAHHFHGVALPPKGSARVAWRHVPLISSAAVSPGEQAITNWLLYYAEMGTVDPLLQDQITRKGGVKAQSAGRGRQPRAGCKEQQPQLQQLQESSASSTQGTSSAEEVPGSPAPSTQAQQASTPPALSQGAVPPAVVQLLPNEELLLSTFKQIDTDLNGALDEGELRAALEALGLPCCREYIADMLHEYDHNHDGTISYDEFKRYTTQRETDMAAAFRAFDEDGNGEISADELGKALRAAGLPYAATRSGRVRRMMAMLDQDANQGISYEEFRRFACMLPRVHSSSHTHLLYAWANSCLWLEAMAVTPPPVSEGEEEAGQGHDRQSYTAAAVARQISSPNEPMHRLLVGGIAGVLSRTLIAPLERLRTMMMLSSQPRGLLESVQAMWTDGGFKGLFRGHMSTVLKVFPTTAIQFTVVNQAKEAIQKVKGSNELTDVDCFLAGCLAGGISCIVSHPLDTIRTQMAVVKGAGMLQIARSIGVRGLYRGFGLACFQEVLGNGIGFLSVDKAVDLFREIHEGRAPSSKERAVLAALAASVTMTIVMPLDVVVRRIQAQGMPGHPIIYNSAFHAFTKIANEEGVGAFYRGMLTTYLKTAPSMGAVYFFFDWLSKSFGLGGLNRYRQMML